MQFLQDREPVIQLSYELPLLEALQRNVSIAIRGEMPRGFALGKKDAKKSPYKLTIIIYHGGDMSKPLMHYFKKHCGRIFLKYEFTFYFLQFSLLPDSKLKTRPFVFLFKVESRCFFCLWYKHQKDNVRRSGETEMPGSQSEIRRKGDKIFPRKQQKRVEWDGLGRGRHQ